MIDREALEQRRGELVAMLETMYGRLYTDLEAVENDRRLVAQLEGGIVETDAWLTRLNDEE